MNRQFDKFTAIYTRIDYPGDSWAVQVQMRSLEQYAKEQGFDNLHHYSDNGFSGITAQRPAFQRMLQDMEDGRLARIVIKDLSRLFRSSMEAIEFVENTLPQYGVVLYTMTEPLIPAGLYGFPSKAQDILWRGGRRI
ncbi:recombinase family protein [Clostridium sp.]|mgnify:CR=1 FL=1|uniref:recombinase family protein n=1 Tax=Clostridium sp. TaxID=1506 RepID=UPI00307B4C4C